MQIEEKDGRSLANANSLVENPSQDHEYSEEETPNPSQAVFEGKGEASERVVKPSKATAGRHVTSGKDGRDVAKERESHVIGQRKETEAVWDAHRKGGKR